MNRIIGFLVVWFSLFSGICFSQISGKIIDEKGLPLPFASVLIQGTTMGTNANSEGFYSLELSKGNHTLVFQYVGYQSVKKEIAYVGKPIGLDIVLQSIDLEIKEVEIKANAEDPAYRIIRNAIAKRDFYQNQVATFRCDAYVKAIQRVADVPKKIMGQEIGTLGGRLDSTGKGIVYLSESVSNYYFNSPSQKKEVMVSSKVSGKDNGLSFNRATPLQEVSFYNNYISIQRKQLSPIADNALAYYDYHLIGSYYENGAAIYKIQVLPKRSEDPVFRGFIYINDNSWTIHSTELYLTSSATKTEFIDTFWIRQVHVPVGKDNILRLFSQNFEIKLQIFGIKIHADYTGVFTNYDLKPNLDNSFFSNELFLAEKASTQKDSSYWATTRPMPLTTEEQYDYKKKDSLKVIWKSKPYMDSMDKVNNKFGFMSLLFGYQYSRSYKKWSFGTISPLLTLQFNPIQGYYADISSYFRKAFDEDEHRWFKINPVFQFGFSDERWRFSGKMDYHDNDLNFRHIELEGGFRKAAQMNEQNPMTSILNSYYNLFEKELYPKFFEKNYLRTSYSEEVLNGLKIKVEAEYAKRFPLVNTTQYSLLYRNKRYSSNDPLNPLNEGAAFTPYKALLTAIELRWQPAQKYSMLPDRKILRRSPYPYFTVFFRKGWQLEEASSAFNQISLGVTHNDIPAGLFGYGESSLKWGTFFNTKNHQFVDYKHFSGNSNDLGVESFMRVFRYNQSTHKSYLEFHYLHHFNGYFLDKIPLVKKMKFNELIGVGHLLTGDGKQYSEVSLGVENVGWGIFRLFTVHVVASFENGKYYATGLAFKYGR